jgi:excisionase family DNA binding protein
MTVGQVARLMGVSPRTVARWCDTGTLPGYRIPGSTARRFRRSDVERFDREHRIIDSRPVVLAVGLADDDADALALMIDGAASLVRATGEFDCGALLVAHSPAVAVIDTAMGGAEARALAGRLAARLPAVLAFGPVPIDEGDILGLSWLGARPGTDRLAIRVLSLLLSRGPTRAGAG